MAINLVYAALLLHSAGKPVNEANIETVAKATGDHPDHALVKALVTALEGVNIQDAISKAAMPVAVAAAPAAGAAPATEEKKAEEDKKKAEEAVEGLGSLFG